MDEISITDRAEMWLRDHGDMLFAYALQRVRRPEIAEDLVQDTLIAAMQAWERYQGDSTVSTWLVGILRHKVLDDIRRRQRGPAWLEEVRQETDAPHPAFKDGFWVTSQESWADIAPGAETEEALDLIRDCLEGMSEPMRLAFTLREIDGVSSRIICEVLGITPTNLWTLVHRAKLKLRADLGKRWSVRSPREEA